MTYLLKHPHTSLNTLRRIDIAPLAALYMAAIVGFNALRLAGNYRRMPMAARKIHAVLRAIIKAKIHNHHLDLKLAMLLNSAWRTRVLRELGGSRKLELWMKALMRAEGILPKRRVSPKPQEPVWWRTPERIARSEALKAHARFCAKACLPQGTVRDPFKMDQSGQFRLAPLPRVSSGQPCQAVIYTKLTISDYNYNAVPIYRSTGFGPACVSPFEFIAAAQIAATVTDADTQEGPQRALCLTSDDDGESDIECLPLPEFLGMAAYMNLFYKPP